MFYGWWQYHMIGRMSQEIYLKIAFKSYFSKPTSFLKFLYSGGWSSNLLPRHSFWKWIMKKDWNWKWFLFFIFVLFLFYERKSALSTLDFRTTERSSSHACMVYITGICHVFTFCKGILGGQLQYFVICKKLFPKYSEPPFFYIMTYRFRYLTSLTSCISCMKHAEQYCHRLVKC